ncbi:MAG TPA: hypothetical protein VNN80_16570 [Polyangiaceae bacterium]|jgi:hypothetical protein|nr:hypothetical protein [Polyangiaceae bacterium]
MAGRVKRLIDELIDLRAAGNPGVVHFMRAHLMLNGIDPSRYTETSPDDQQKEQRLEEMIGNFSKQMASIAPRPPLASIAPSPPLASIAPRSPQRRSL